MQLIENQVFCDERALFGTSKMKICGCVFDKGESAIKECSDLNIDTSLFRWKYPFWYSRNIKLTNSRLFEMARAAVWYIDGISIEDTVIEAPKCIRRSKNVTLKNVTITNGPETLWDCDGVLIDNVQAKGDYFALNAQNINANNLTLIGNYNFDGVKNVCVKNSKILSRDAFWNSENVIVENSFISGEYLGWNAKNLTLINCTIESLQGLCYIDNLVMKNCRLINTTLAFEYSDVDAEINGNVTSILNPKSGTIKADSIGELIIQKHNPRPDHARIVCDSIIKSSDKISW